MEISRPSAEPLPKEKATLNGEGEAGCGEQPEDYATDDSLSLESRCRGNGSAEVPENRVQKNRKRCECQLPPLYISYHLFWWYICNASNDSTTVLFFLGYGCNKKVGLVGVQCKCGLVFCALHRYPEEHDCTFDFKGHGRKNLAKELVGGGHFEKVTSI